MRQRYFPEVRHRYTKLLFVVWLIWPHINMVSGGCDTKLMEVFTALKNAIVSNSFTLKSEHTGMVNLFLDSVWLALSKTLSQIFITNKHYINPLGKYQRYAL